jgi:hypothetical protein
MTREHEGVRVGSDEFRQVSGDLVSDVGRDGDPSSPGVCLGWARHESPPYVHDLLTDAMTIAVAPERCQAE